MTRVCLIIPPSPFLLDERVFMSLGPLKVAAALERAGMPVEVLDLSGVKNYEDAVRAHARQSWDRVYGITATSPQLPAAVKIAKAIRDTIISPDGHTIIAGPSPRIVLGGPHVTLVNAARKRFEKRLKGESCRATRAFAKLWEHFDILVAGDGEEAILDALEGTPPRLIDADGRDKPAFLDDARLTQSAFPARHLVDVASYHYTIDGVPALSLIAQLGCLAAGTMIRLANGRDVLIETVKTGDRVICWNEGKRVFGDAPVVGAWSRKANDLLKITTSCATILVTSEHPLWTDSGWKRAGDVEPSKDRCGVKAAGAASPHEEDQGICFVDIEAVEFIGESEVYNLTVCPGHSYIANGLVVHNCPFGCGFCAGRHSPMLRHIRTRPTQSIVAEMVEMADRYGTRGFMFYDDELNVNPKLVELMDAITVEQAQRGEQWRLRGFVKAELFTSQQAAAMYRAGFRWILVGFESGSDRILDNINKKATKADNTRCVGLARNAGLNVKALMSIGHPGESAATIEDTKQWLLDVRPDDFDVTIITPYPGSPYYDEAVPSNAITWTYSCRNGDRLHQFEVDYTQEADYYKGSPDDGYVAHVWTDHVTATDLIVLRDRLERDLRSALGIPFNPAAPAMLYEHSMGMTSLPPHILRTSKGDQPCTTNA